VSKAGCVVMGWYGGHDAWRVVSLTQYANTQWSLECSAVNSIHSIERKLGLRLRFS
jgi:hypothetical protein